jgi:hypothetical protein
MFQLLLWQGLDSLNQGFTNPGRRVARATKLCTVAPNVFGSPKCKLFHVTLPAPTILRLLLDFWKTFGPLV